MAANRYTTGNATSVEHIQILQEALGWAIDEQYTEAKSLSKTGIVSANSTITGLKDDDTYSGQIKWKKALRKKVNTASLTDRAKGELSSSAQDFAAFIKRAATTGTEDVAIADIIGSVDQIAELGREYAVTRALDEDDAVVSILRGVAISEALIGTSGAGGQTFENDPKSQEHGFYVDLGTAPLVAEPTEIIQGAQRAKDFISALTVGFKDYEAPYYYLVVSPETMLALRTANLVDTTKITEGNLEFSTIFNGKFRIIQSRANIALSQAEIAKLNANGGGVAITGTRASYIIAPGSIAYAPLSIKEDIGYYSDASAYHGAGAKEVWYRWGYIMHPGGYNWLGDVSDFASIESYSNVLEGGNLVSLATATTPTAGTWQRKATSVLTLGILPVFHG